MLRKRETAEMLLRVENEKKKELRDKNLEKKLRNISTDRVSESLYH